ncbi:MAG TPA: SOS response-associated peptidase [Leptospiraceae bacterium]|nr:SOS response-associated peptidase [Leptospiraceae bacterium]
MCSRFSLKSKMQELQEQFQTHNIIEDMDFKDEFLPTNRILVIWRNTEIDQNEMKLMRWGLIPNFVKDFEQIKKYSLFNARSETLEEKPAFRTLLDSNRCLIPVDIFYEFKAEGKVKDKYAFTLNPESTFAMAGLWDKWINPKTKEEIFSCTIITTVANEVVRPIHENNRMPVVLERDSYSDWLDPQIKFSNWRDRMNPFDSNKMKSEKVARADKQSLSQVDKIKISNESKFEDNQPSLFGSK